MFTVVAVREYVLERQMVDDFEQSAGQLNLKKKKAVQIKANASNVSNMISPQKAKAISPLHCQDTYYLSRHPF